MKTASRLLLGVLAAASLAGVAAAATAMIRARPRG